MTSADGPLLTFVGAATLDALALVEQYPAADERVVASQLVYAGGGPAATAAVTAARLGHRTAFVGTVGDDEEGERIVAGLQAEEVDTVGVCVAAGERSGASVVVVASATATRAICNRPLPLTDAVGSPAVRELFRASAWVHTDHLGWRPTRSALATQSFLTTRPRLAHDGGHLLPGFTCAGLDLYAPTIEALRARYGDLPSPELLVSARNEGAGLVVASEGARGCHLLDLNGCYQHVPGVEVDVVSTLGAGDVFHGALVAGLADGHPAVEAARRANAVAAASCRALDGRSSIPTAVELDAYLAAAVADERDRSEPLRSPA